MTYTIDTESNSYFQGRDAVLHKDGERVAKIALKNDRPAIYVKVYSWGSGDPEIKRMERDLGDERVEQIIENIRWGFWHFTAPECVRENGHYEDVWSAGRSEGWCVPHATHRDTDWHWWEECVIDAPFETESTDEMSQADARRWWFFQAAEAITAEVEYVRTEEFDEMIRDAHYDLEQSREACLVRGEN